MQTRKSHRVDQINMSVYNAYFHPAQLPKTAMPVN